MRQLLTESAESAESGGSAAGAGGSAAGGGSARAQVDQRRVKARIVARFIGRRVER
ncbi:hypothetical protein GCM10010349_24960 [Streptomyces flavofungini]|nr:hypothetical protein GCM10010349_24960 [Streptomyces flavofungini]